MEYTRKPREAQWVKFMQHGLIELSDMKLTQTEYRIILLLAGSVGYSNYWATTQTAFAARLKAAQSNISQALNKLEKMGILKVKKENGQTHYGICKAFIQKGRDAQWVK